MVRAKRASAQFGKKVISKKVSVPQQKRQINPNSLLGLMSIIAFDPRKRITVTEALQHPYLAGLYDPRCNPPAQYPISLNIDESMGEPMIREMMWNEILHYHPHQYASSLHG
ncbi:uncharacterized protein J3R85_012551 [Psidium guajava]|nr:uncharacterized protein J3R85_012551 [Psidium guajava]